MPLIGQCGVEHTHLKDHTWEVMKPCMPTHSNIPQAPVEKRREKRDERWVEFDDGFVKSWIC